MARSKRAENANVTGGPGFASVFATLADRDGLPAGSSQAWFADQRTRAVRWRRFVVGCGLLAGLYYVGNDVIIYTSRAGEALGLSLFVPFVAAYLLMFMNFDRLPARWFWTSYAAMVVVSLAELPFAHAEGFVLFEYVAMVTAFRLAERCLPIVAAMTVAAVVVPAAVPSWHEGLTTGVDNATAVMIPILALVVVGSLRWQRASGALTLAKAEIARLAAENERARIARDLHDLLGHSLTTITVKAGLASRLAGADPARAAKEIGEVEALARRSLSDVRAAVSSYREVTLANELAAGRELLSAADITADFPGAVDAAAPEHSELFGWAVREALTNVARHSRATWCSVRLSPSGVEILDDGAGVGGRDAGAGRAVRAGNGLSGLRDRVAAAGGTLEAGPVQPKGWRLRVSMPGGPGSGLGAAGEVPVPGEAPLAGPAGEAPVAGPAGSLVPGRLPRPAGAGA